MYLIGTFYHALEQKGRLSVPKKFRTYFEGRVVITLGLDGCLFVFHTKQFEHLLDDQSHLSVASKRARDWTRLLTNNATEVEVDTLGRILVPENLRHKAGINKQVVIVGSLNRLEIWDQTTYHAYVSEIEKNKEIIAEAISQIEYDDTKPTTAHLSSLSNARGGSSGTQGQEE